jgi:MFS family permease
MIESCVPDSPRTRFPSSPHPIPSSATSATDRYVPAWRVVLVGVVTLVTALGQLYVVLPMLGLLARLPGVDAGGTSVAVTAFALPYAAGFLLFGPLTDRFGSRALMTASILGVLTGTALAAIAQDWSLFLLARGIQGLCAAPFTPAIMALIQTRLSPAHRRVATSAIISSGMGSAVVAQVSGQVGTPVVGVHGMFALSAVALLACLVLIVVLVPRSPMRRTAKDVDGSSPRVRETYRGLLTPLARPRLALLVVVALTYLTVFVGLYAALQLADGASGGTVDATSLLILRASALPAIVAVPVLAPWLARIPARRRVLLGLGLAAVATIVIGGLAVTGVLTLPAFGVGMLVTGGALAVAAPATVTEVMAMAPGSEGAANALYSAAIFGGASLGTPLAGMVLGIAGPGDRGLGAFALTCGVLLLLAAALVTVALRPTPGRQEE